MKKNELVRDQRKQTEKQKLASLTKRYGAALDRIAELEAKVSSVGKLSGSVAIHRIDATTPSGNGEAACVWVASDWHVDEKVNAVTVNNLNRYGMAIAKKRSETFFRSSLRITQMLGRDIEVKTVILALLGDFYSGHIHDELVEVTETQPVRAVIYAQNLIASGIQYVLDNSEYDLVIPCHSGNHGRTTKTTHFATENGHSLEYFMYRNLEQHFAGNPRVRFLISESYLSYVRVFGWTLRFHHGHATRYSGGVGGLTIPMNKAIAQWDKAIKADYSICGHYHQFTDGGNFLVNGSLIGYNAYAMSIKAAFEKPKQMLFLLDKKRGKTVTAPILFD